MPVNMTEGTQCDEGKGGRSDIAGSRKKGETWRLEDSERTVREIRGEEEKKERDETEV